MLQDTTSRLTKRPISSDEAMAQFRSEGANIADWARERGFSPRLVYQVLTGTRKCLRGKSHEIAEALGMK